VANREVRLRHPAHDLVKGLPTTRFRIPFTQSNRFL